VQLAHIQSLHQLFAQVVHQGNMHPPRQPIAQDVSQEHSQPVLDQAHVQVVLLATIQIALGCQVARVVPMELI